MTVTPPTTRRPPRRGFPARILLTALLLASLGPGCSAGESSSSAKPAAAPPVPITAATVARRTVPFQIEGVGTVAAYATVAVKARVDGEIVSAGFRDGDEVKKGQILFQIDPRPFRALLRQAQAAVARDQAQLVNARAEVKRYEDLLAKHFVSHDAYAQMRTNAEVYAASVKADAAAVDNAQLQLSYCTIRSPINGRVGRTLIQPGNLVKANDTNPLVVINQIKPIYVDFSVPERWLSAIRSAMRGGELPVHAHFPNAPELPDTGHLASVDNAVDTATGTIHLRAVFENPREDLWPGQFVTATLTLHQQPDAVLIPSQALQTGPTGEYVFVIRPDKTVEMRKVTVDRPYGADTIIARGLKPGERIVTDGQSRLVPGAKIRVTAPAGVP